MSVWGYFMTLRKRFGLLSNLQNLPYMKTPCLQIKIQQYQEGVSTYPGETSLNMAFLFCVTEFSPLCQMKSLVERNCS